MVSNTKTFIFGTYHGLPKDKLPSYLARFDFHFSCRDFGGVLFGRLAIAMLTTV